MIDEKTIRQWWDVFKKNAPLTEIRILSGKKNYSGYFKDVDSMINQMRQYDGCGIYATLNEVKEACYGRTQMDTIIQAPKSTTNDNDIERRRWLLIDFDPERPSDTNASEKEKEVAEARMRQVCKFLRNEGFYMPVVADSANGYHLYYRIDLPNTEESTNMVRDFLRSLDALFSDDSVKVDVSVFNASRIVKVIGTSSNKGKGTKERPQRVSRFVYVPDDIRVNGTPFIEKVASYIPKPEGPEKSNGWHTERFDLERFIEEHGIKVVNRTRYKEGDKFVLEECPFDHNHKDAAILRMDSGAIGFKCFHNSCSHYGWKEFRLHYEPDAYTKKEREEYRSKREYYGVRRPEPPKPLKEDERGKVLLSMSDVKYVDTSSIVHIPTGLARLDREIVGLALGDVTVLSGLSGAGKSTILDLFILSAVQSGYKVMAWSGELQDFRFQGWLDQMAAGKDLVRQKAGYENFYYCPKNVAEKIHDWLDGKFWLFNNDYGAEWPNLKEEIEKAVHEKGVRLVVLDNLMAVDFDGPASDNDIQTRFIKEVKNLAKRENIHVVLVCHPRKEQSFQLLRKESIAGTANLTNLCDNLFIVHRVGRDFEKRAKDFWGESTVQQLVHYDLVIEVAKNRSMGVVDVLAGLYYEKETRRVLNDPAENVIYGWRETPTEAPIFEEDIPDEIWYNQN
jgi:archaellum biogenesis ATPase FlaH